MNLLAFICWLRDEGFIWNQSRERPGQPLSNSEIRRWIQNGSIEVNGVTPRAIEAEIEYPVSSLVLFPGGKRECTLI